MAGFNCKIPIYRTNGKLKNVENLICSIYICSLSISCSAQYMPNNQIDI